MTKCKTCNEREAVTGAGQCNLCYKRDYRRINKDKIKRVKERYYINHRKEFNERAKNWTKKNGYKPNRIETEESKRLHAIRSETRRLYKLGTAKCEFCNSLAKQHHHYSEPIQVHYFWYVCTKCHNKIHHPEVNGELIIPSSLLQDSLYKEKK